MSHTNNARICEIYLEYDNSNVEHAKAQPIINRYIKHNQFDEALDAFLELAFDGDRIFQHNAGVLLQCIDDVRDYQSAFEWYKKSVAQNYAPAKERLGSMYEFGDGGLPVDHHAAIALYRESSDQGNLHSTYNLGMMLAKGSSCVARNLPLALQLLNRAAEQGHGLMKMNLGVIYLEDCNNEDAASYWFKQAFDQDTYVSVDLGHYFLHRAQNRRQHRNKHLELSHYWFSVAVAYGYQENVVDLFEGDQDVIKAFEAHGQFH